MYDLHHGLLAQLDSVRAVAHGQIREGLGFLLRHLADHDLRDSVSDDSIFRTLEDTTYLAKAGEVALINSDGSGLVFDGPNGGFVHPWELYDANIQHGKHLIDDAILKYGST